MDKVVSLGIEELRFPLMCLVDYLGHRLVAISILPISPSSSPSQEGSLVYGTQDGGKTFKFEDKKARKFAQEIGEKLNLKKHSINSPNNTQIYTPADIEIHKGTVNHKSLFAFTFNLNCFAKTI